MHAPSNQHHAPLVPLPYSDVDNQPNIAEDLPPPRTELSVPRVRRERLAPQPTSPRRSARASKGPDRLGTWAKKAGDEVIDAPKTWK